MKKYTPQSRLITVLYDRIDRLERDKADLEARVKALEARVPVQVHLPLPPVQHNVMPPQQPILPPLIRGLTMPPKGYC